MRSPSSCQDGQSVLPQLRLLGREGGSIHTLIARLIGVHPRLEVLRAQFRKGEQEIRQIALRIDHQGRDAVDRRLFQQSDTKAGFAAACHADAHGVGHQIGRIVEQEPAVIFSFAKVEDAELFIVGQHL